MFLGMQDFDFLHKPSLILLYLPNLPKFYPNFSHILPKFN